MIQSSPDATATTSPRAEALRRFLGVRADAEPREILAIRGALLTEGRIESAARRRWRQVSQHPAAGEPGAHFARAAIVQAAETLLGRVPGRGPRSNGPPAAVASAAEQFDLRIVEAIRSSGGLNRGAALRLAKAARASDRSVEETLQRLRQLVTNGAFRGRRRSAGGWRVARRLVRRGSGVPREIARLLEEVEGVVGEALQPDAARRRETATTVALVASLIAVVFLVALVRLLPEGSSAGGEDRAAAGAGAVAERDAAGSAGRTPLAVGSPGGAAAPEPEPVVETFVRFVLPPGATPAPPEELETQRSAAGLAAADVPSRLDDLSRRIRGRNGNLDAALLEGWRSIQSVPARCWFDMSPELLRRTLGASREVVSAVETWTAAESLVQALGDLDPRRATAADLRGGAWGAGLVGDLVRRPGLAGAVRDQLQRRLDVLGLPPRTGWVAPDAFEETAARWLAAAVEGIAKSAGGQDVEDAWAVWTSIAERVEPIGLREALLVEGVRRLIREWEDGDELSARPRRIWELLVLLGPAVASNPEGVRSVLQETASPGARFGDPTAAWVLSSLIADRPEFGEWAPLPPRADGATIAMWLDDALATWPLPARPATNVDPERLQRIRDLVAVANQRSRRDPAATISLLRTMGRLNVAIADPRQSRARSRVIFEEVELDLLGSGDLGVDPARTSAESTSLDGRFAGAMRQALDNRTARIDLVRELRRRSGGDLGPDDAAALARAAVKDAPEVRQAASAVLLERFGSGPNVLEAYQAAIAGSETDPLVVRTVERLAGVALPATRSPEAVVEIRRRLAERLLAAWPSDARRLDLAMGRYAATLAERRGGSADAAIADPVAEAVRLTSQRLQRLEGRPSLEAILDRRDRRRGVAEGPSQRLAGELVTLVESELEIARLERPDLAEAIGRLSIDAVRRRQRSESSLEQTLEMELVLAELAVLLAEGGEA